MTNERIQTIEAGHGQEIRFEIERLPVGRQARRGTRVSMRVWSSLSGMPDKVPTGKGFSVEAARFGDFKEAVLRAARALESS